MKENLFIILLILNTVFSSKVNSSSSNTLIENDLSEKHLESCKHIKCPPLVDPLCVKIRFRSPKKKSKSVLMVLLNECELQYFGCYNGFDIESTRLPMKYCEHPIAPKTHGQVGKVRGKRSADVIHEYHGTTETVDLEQYNAECPTVCPARVQMVCGKCQHGIYKTFLSVCHLRKLVCEVPQESMELVSRYPCGLSSPFLVNQSPPQGIVEEQEDDDPVLRYITCRSDIRGFNWMKMNDPRCNFHMRNKYMLYSNEYTPIEMSSSDEVMSDAKLTEKPYGITSASEAKQNQTKNPQNQANEAQNLAKEPQIQAEQPHYQGNKPQNQANEHFNDSSAPDAAHEKRNFIKKPVYDKYEINKPSNHPGKTYTNKQMEQRKPKVCERKQTEKPTQEKTHKTFSENLFQTRLIKFHDEDIELFDE